MGNYWSYRIAGNIGFAGFDNDFAFPALNFVVEQLEGLFLSRNCLYVKITDAVLIYEI